jgi:co-chaperonin GroES (HSP10)
MKFRPLHDRIVINVSKPRQEAPEASSFPTPPRKSPSKAKLLPLVPADVMRPASSFQSTSKLVTGFYSASGPAPRPRSMTTNT